MILGMSIGAFTLLHVIITLIAIGSGLWDVRLAQVARHDRALSFYDGADQLDGLPVSHQGLHAGSGCWNRSLRDSGGGTVCFVQRALGRLMAVDLCDHRNRIALFERFCPNRAEFYEGARPESVGADGV
jgi:hypothetical protein